MQGPHHLAGLDGLRGIAALCVLMLHVGLYFELGGAASLMAHHAYLAVDGFYMISGFVIAHAFDRKMECGYSVGRFFLSRVMRLYPMLLVGSLLGIVTLSGLKFTHPGIQLTSMISAACMGLVLMPSHALVAYKPYVFPLNSSYWSLSLEFVLYLLYAAAFHILHQRWAMRCMLIVSGAALAQTAFVNGSLDVGYRYADYHLGFIRCAFPFLAGMAIRRSPIYRPGTLPFGSLAILLVLPLLCNPLASSGAYDAAAVLFVYPFIIIAAANSARLPGLDAVSTWIGELSFPIYAIHYPIVVACGNACRMLHLSAVLSAICAISCSFMTIVVASVLLRTYDRPLRLYLGRRLAVSTAAEGLKKASAKRTDAGSIVDDCAGGSLFVDRRLCSGRESVFGRERDHSPVGPNHSQGFDLL